ncbi:MAG: glycosyltransferase family 4 protein [Anaeromyxobacter sp.]|nr:glycosyltransferase family 4 protein [Anaeromyxobacter sp.]
MKVLLLNQFFHPDHSATAQLATDLAEDLVLAGHQVTALAARGGYLGGERLPARELHRGVRIVRVHSTSLGKGSVPARLCDYTTFFCAAFIRALLLPRFDAVVAMSTPPLVATIGGALRTLKRTRFVYWLQDVYPELAVEFGVLGAGSLPARALDLASRATLKRADAVVVLGEAMGNLVEGKGVPPDRVHLLPNWSDGQAVRPVEAGSNEFRRRHGLDGKKVVLYSGNMGRGHDMRTLLDAARLLVGHPEVVFMFVGDGAKRAEVEAEARDLPSVRCLPYQPRSKLSESLSAGDIHVVSQDPGTLGLIEPSKIYGVMAVGRPMLYIGPATSEAACTVSRENIGEVVPCGDAPAAAAAILRLLRGGPALGTAARAAFERAYDRRLRTAAFELLLRSLDEGA